jgi:NADPH-dependent glutamate synthase beta subunit-like oxidoreductase
MEGIIYKPVVDHAKCGVCSICMASCPADKIPELQTETDSVRGKIYQQFQPQPLVVGEATEPVPPCRLNCPLNQDVSGYLRLISQGRFPEALALVRETNPLPSVCGYVCHRPCESACYRGAVDNSLSIRSMKRFLTDLELDMEIPKTVAGKTGCKVVIIGSGPAGLTAAHDLALKGHEVEIFESYSQPGGMLVWAIPEFRLPRNALQRDINFLKSLGIKIRLNQVFGSDLTIADLKAQGASAVILAAGTMKSLNLGLEASKSENTIIDCLSFLNRFNQRDYAGIGRKAVIVGGGNAALDSARAVLAAGVEAVDILYRRRRKEMPVDPSEIEDALKEGVKIKFQTIPIKVQTVDGKIKGLDCLKTEMVAVEGRLRKRPVPIADSEFFVEADTVISAVGQEVDYEAVLPGFSGSSSDGLWDISDDTTMISHWEGVFAAGDFVNGAGTVVDAMASGRKCAQAVNRYVSK